MADHLTASLPEIQEIIIAPLSFGDAQLLGRTNRYWAKTWRSFVTNTRMGEGPARRFAHCPLLRHMGLTTLDGLTPELFAAWPRLADMHFWYHGQNTPTGCPLPTTMPNITKLRLDTWQLMGTGKTTRTADAFVLRFPNLEKFVCGGNGGHHGMPSNLAALSRLVRLTTLNIGSNDLFDLGNLAHLTSLTKLRVSCDTEDRFTISAIRKLHPLIRRGKLRELLLQTCDDQDDSMPVINAISDLRKWTQDMK